MQWFRVRLHIQLLGAFLLLSLLTAVVGAIGYRGMGNAAHALNNLAEEDLTYVLLAHELAIDNLQLRRYEKDMLLHLAEERKRTEYRDKYQKILDKTRRDASELARLTLIDPDLREESRAAAARLGASLDRYSAGVLQVVSSGQSLTAQQANERIGAVKDATHGLELDAALLAEQGRNMIRAKTRSTTQLLSGEQRQLLAIMGGIFGFSILAGLLLARSITRPLGVVQTLLGELSQGDLRGALPERVLRRGDEIGELARSLQRLRDSIADEIALLSAIAEGDWTRQFPRRAPADQLAPAVSGMIEGVSGMIAAIRRLGERLNGSGAELAAAADGLSQGAVEAAASIEQIHASMTQIAAQARHNAENATQTRLLAESAGHSSREGERKMSAMVGAMREITLSHREVHGIIRTIDEIAFQTHLLALNASVEAARAGSAGKGFAVVAAEVGELAARSTSAAVETTRLIEESAEKVGNGMRIAEETAGTLQEIASAVLRVNDIAGEIASAAQEQSRAVAEIDAGLGQLDVVTQQNTARAEESASATQELAALAATMRQQLSSFQIRESVEALPEYPGSIRADGHPRRGVWPVYGSAGFSSAASLNEPFAQTALFLPEEAVAPRRAGQAG